MSYCVSLRDRDTGDVATTALPLRIDGDNVRLNEPGPLTVLSTKITYNYNRLFVKAFAGGLGLGSLHGRCAEDSVPDLCAAIAGLGDYCGNYWQATEGNAKMALLRLLQMAVVARSDAVWEVT